VKYKGRRVPKDAVAFAQSTEEMDLYIGCDQGKGGCGKIETLLLVMSEAPITTVELDQSQIHSFVS
jgi:hypothetical protein